MKTGRNNLCPCGSGKKYKRCCLDKKNNPIPQEVLQKATEYFKNLPKEPFEKGGFLTGRPFIDAINYDNQTMARAIGSTLYFRPIDETFHLFLLNKLSEWIGKKWFDEQKKEEVNKQHPVLKWIEETNCAFEKVQSEKVKNGEMRSVKMNGNMRALLAIAYDFYSLKHCGAIVLPKLLNRFKNRKQFQGARYEIAVGGLVVRSGFEIKWVNDKNKHCEFIGIHKITKDKIAFEAKSHHRRDILGQDEGSNAKIKVLDHIKEAIEQSPTDMPLVLFDDLNLPLTPNESYREKRWFNDIDQQLKKYNFLEYYKNTQFGALFVTNFSWHFHSKIPPKRNEVLSLFHMGNKYSLKPETILNYLKLASEQYGYVPAKLEEFNK